MWILGLLKSAIPWDKIGWIVLAAAVLLGIGLYIKNAEDNRAKVVTLESSNKELSAANSKLIADHQQAIEVLTDNFNTLQNQEAEYDTNIDKIKSLPDGVCVRGSAPIIESIRLRRARTASGND